MTTGDVVTLVGVIVAAVAIAVPLMARAYADQLRFRAGIRYRLEGYANAAQLVARQALDLASSTVVDMPADLRVSLVADLRARTRDFLGALTEDAARVDRKLGTTERRSTWHLMMTNIEVAVGRELNSADQVAAAAAQAVCTAYVGLLVLGLCRDSEEAETWLRVGLSMDGGIDTRLRAFAEGLLPDDTLARVSGREDESARSAT